MVEVRRRLVQYVERRIGHFHRCEHEALLLAAAHVVHIAPAQILDGKRICGVRHALVNGVGIDPCNLQPERQLIIGCEVEELRLRVLEHVSHIERQLIRLAYGWIIAANRHAAQTGDPRLEVRYEPVQALGERRFPGTRTPTEEHALASSHLQAHIVQEFRAICRLATQLLYVNDLFHQ